MEDSQKRYYSYLVTIVAVISIVLIAGLVIPFSKKQPAGNAALNEIAIDDTSPIPTSSTPPTGLMSPLMLLSPQSGASASALAASTDPPGTTDFYGTVTIDGAPAPEGTIIAGITADGAGFTCGSFVVTSQNPGLGWYGFLHCSCGGNSPTCSGENIALTVNGQLAVMTGVRTWDESIRRVDLSSTTKCTDGTLFNHCKASAPLYCAQTAPNTGSITNNCAVCGCPPAKKIGGRYVKYVCCAGSGQCSLENNPAACPSDSINS